MAEPRPLTDREHYEQRACQSLVQHSGWREVLLPLVAQQLAETERTAGRLDLPDGVRLGAVDQRHALLWLLASVYKKADETNPFDAARLTLWSTLAPPRTEEKRGALENHHRAAQALETQAQRRRASGGSVA